MKSTIPSGPRSRFRQSPLKHWRAHLRIAFLAAVLPILGAWFSLMLTDAQLAAERSRAAVVDQVVVDLTRREIERRIETLQVLRELMEGGTTRGATEFRSAAEAIERRVTGFVAINLIDADRLIAAVVPEERNAAALGRRVGQSPEIVALLDAAQSTRTAMATRLVPLFQGGLGVAVYLPIYSGAEFRGFVNGVLDIAGLMRDVGDRLEPVVRVSLSEGDAPGREPRGVIHLADRSVRLLNREWIVGVEHAVAAVTVYTAALPVVTALALSALILVIVRQYWREELAHRRLLGAVNSIPAEFWLFDREERLVVANAAARQRCYSAGLRSQPGMQMTEFMPLCIRAARPPDATNAAIRELPDRRFGENREGDRDWDEMGPSGKWHHNILRSTDDGDRIIIRLDITDRKTAEVAGSEKNAQLTAIMDSAPFAVFLKDRQGRYLVVNRYWASLALGPGASPVGLPSSAIFSGALAAWMAESDTTVLSEGKVVYREWDGVTCRDPTVTDLAITKFPIKTPNGEIVGVGGIAVDISARKSAEQRAAAIQTELSAAIEGSVDGFVTIDEQGSIRTFSRAAERIFGYSADEVIGRNVSMLMPEPHRSAHDGYIAAYRSTGVAKVIGIGREVIGRRKDGSDIPIDLSISQFQGTNGLRCYAGTLRDTSDRKVLERRLAQAHRLEALGQLTGGVAHDFNNILAAVLGNLELMQARIKDDSEIASRLTAAIRSIVRGRSLTQKLLAMGGRQSLHPQPIDMASVVADVISLVRTSLGASYQIEGIVEPRSGAIMADHGALESALLNLVLNARDAMAGGGKVVISAKTRVVHASTDPVSPQLAPGRYGCISVRDSGTGMTPDVVAHAFEPFFSTKPRGKGSGLGLSMVLGFARQSGGDVDIESAVGRGTTVTLWLPHCEAATSPALNGAGGAINASIGTRALVVDDDAELRATVAAQLRSQGYQVTTAASGAEAFEIAAREKRFDLVLSDVLMPGPMDGVALAENLRRIHPTLPVVLVSGYVGDGAMVQRIAATGCTFLDKPFTQSEMERAVSSAISQAIREEHERDDSGGGEGGLVEREDGRA